MALLRSVICSIRTSYSVIITLRSEVVDDRFDWCHSIYLPLSYIRSKLPSRSIDWLWRECSRILNFEALALRSSHLIGPIIVQSICPARALGHCNWIGESVF